MKNRFNITCKKCGYKWTARLKSPKACPRCKYRLDSPFESAGDKNNE